MEGIRRILIVVWAVFVFCLLVYARFQIPKSLDNEHTFYFICFFVILFSLPFWIYKIFGWIVAGFKQ
jgi:hypothetical protein